MKQIAAMAGAVVWALVTVGAQAQTTGAGRQAVYDQAQKAYDARQWASAADGFRQLLPTGEAQGPLRRSEAVIAYRYADCLLRLERLDDALMWVDRALPTLAKESNPQSPAEALTIKGGVEELRYDFAAAVEAYDEADRLLSNRPADDLVYQVRAGLAFTDTTRDPAHVLDRLRPLTSAPDFRKTASPPLQAQIEDLEARAEMNVGDLPAAKRLIDQAISDSGGLTERVSIAQVAMRGDAGVIAHLRKDDEGVRRYFAYAGAGHLTNLDWVQDHTGDLPVCGDAADDVHPGDLAVVTFAIGDDGHVMNATPVYASRPGLIGQTFAKAVSDWRWNPAVIKKVELFWRASLQLELRCVNRPLALTQDLSTVAAAMSWLKSHDLVRPAELAFAEGGGSFDVAASDPRLGRPGGVVLAAAAGPVPRYRPAMEALWSRLDAIHAPAAAYALLIERYADKQSEGAAWRGGAWYEARARAEWLPRLRAQFPDDPATRQMLLSQALSLEIGQDYAAALPYLNALTDLPDAQLARDAPLRAVALLHQAIALDHVGRHEAARRTLDQSGLNSGQCSLFDTHPLPQNMQISSDAFPQAAALWNFQGFVQTDYGIADDGRVQDVRAIVSYPPFIFEDTTTKAVSRFRFEPPRLGGKVVGCEDERQEVRYRLGG